MKIFASWSGDLSHGVAALLKTWLEDVLQGCSVWLSSENIEKGSVWFSDVADTLKDTSFGILCVSRHCATAPWLLFEAGALSKGLTSSRVSPLLIDITATDLMPPLSLLNATLPTQREMAKLVKSINNHSGDTRLSEDRLNRAFLRCWPEFEKGFEKLLKEATVTKHVVKRADRELLEEVVDTSKSIYRAIQESRKASEESERKRLESQISKLEVEIAILAEHAMMYMGSQGSLSADQRSSLDKILPLLRAQPVISDESLRRVLKPPSAKKIKDGG